MKSVSKRISLILAAILIALGAFVFAPATSFADNTVATAREFKDITWTETSDGYTAKANYVFKGDDEHTESVDCTVEANDTDPKKTVYTATISADDSLDGEKHTDDKTVYTVYNLYVQGVHVTGENCDDVLGDGTVSFDPEAVKLTLNGAKIEMSRRSYGFGGDKNEYGIRSNLTQKDNLPGSVALDGALTIELLGDNSIANDTPDADTTDKYGIIVFGTPVTFTGGGTLGVAMTADESHNYCGIETRAATTYDGVTVTVNIPGTEGSTYGMSLKYSNQIKLQNAARVGIDVGKGCALDNNSNSGENLSVADGCVFEAVSKGGPSALHGNGWVKIAQDTIDDLGVLVNASPEAQGRSPWDGSTDLSNYKYVYIPGKVTVKLHFSAIDGDDLVEPYVFTAPMDMSLEDYFDDGATDELYHDIWEYFSEIEGYTPFGFLTTLPDSLSEYESWDEVENADTWWDELQADADFYVPMRKYLNEVDITVEPPMCGTETSFEFQDGYYGGRVNPDTAVNMPAVTIETEDVTTYGDLPHDVVFWWVPEDGTRYTPVFNGTFEGGKNYGVLIQLQPEFGYAFGASDELTAKVNGEEVETVVYSDKAYFDFIGLVKAEHDLEEHPRVDPTCIDEGVELHYTCKKCEKIFADAEGTEEVPSYDDLILPIDPDAHDWGEWETITEPTETESGLERRVCKRSDDHVEENEIPPTGKETYTITFDPNGGVFKGTTDPSSIEYEDGETITMPAPTREGYKFLYWKGSKYYAGDKYTVVGNHTLVAQWEKIEKKATPKSGGTNAKAKAKVPGTGDPATLSWTLALAGAGASSAVASYLRRREQ